MAAPAQAIVTSSKRPWNLTVMGQKAPRKQVDCGRTYLVPSVVVHHLNNRRREWDATGVL